MVFEKDPFPKRSGQGVFFCAPIFPDIGRYWPILIIIGILWLGDKGLLKIRLKTIKRLIPSGSLSYLTFTLSPHISLFSLDSLRPKDGRPHLLVPVVNHKKSSLNYSQNPDLGNCHCEGTEAISPFSTRLPPTFQVLARG